MDTPAPAPAPATAAFDNPNPQPSQDLNFDDDFGSLRNAIRSAPDANKGETQKPKEEAPKVEKKQAEKQAEDKPKSLKDKLKVEEEPAEEESTEETTTEEGDEDDLPTYKDRKPTEKEKATWKGLKQAKAEYDKIKPEYEKLKADFEEFKKKPVLDNEVTKELEELRQFRDMTNFKLSDKYKMEVGQPINKIYQEIEEMVVEFKIDETALDKAFKETSEWKRNLAIERVLKEADDEIPTAIAKTILDKAGELHQRWLREIELSQEAAKNLAAYEHEKKQAVTKQMLEEQKAWQQNIDAKIAEAETNLAPIFRGMKPQEKEALMAAMRSAKISDDPGQRALQAIGVELAAALAESWQKLTNENAILKKANKALSAASPASNGRQPEPKKAASDDDDDSLFQAIRSATGR